MRSIAVIKPDMVVLRRDRIGLSSFGILSALFGEEILQRSRRRLGFWRPASLELLEVPEQKAGAGREAGRVGVHLDMTLLLKALREEQRAAQSQEKRENARTVEKLVERVILREQAQRVQERTQRINIQAGSMEHTICVTRQTPPKAGLEPVSSVTSAPPTGGWQPQWRQEHPGFPVSVGKPAQEGGGSILLPDALRRRRERILEELALSAAVERTEELLRQDRLVLREQLKREVTRSVEETLTRQRMQLAQRRMETEPPYRQGGEKISHARKTEERPGKSQAIGREDEERQSDTSAEKKFVEGREYRETAGETELIYREGEEGTSGDQIREVESPSVQPHSIKRKSEEQTSKTVEREQIIESRPDVESTVQPQQDKSTELIYREGGEYVHETESPSVQPHSIHGKSEEQTSEIVKREQIIEGRPSVESTVQPQQDKSAELIYREGGEYVRETESTSMQTHLINRKSKEQTSKTVEREQIIEGRPSVESVVHPQQDTSTELIYREGEDRVRAGESVSVQPHSIDRKSEKQPSETVEKEQIIEGRPSAEPAAQFRQNSPTELIYRAGEDRQDKAAGDGIHLGGTAKEPHTRPLTDQKAGLVYHKERPAQQTAVRDIRTLIPGTPESRTTRLPATRREEDPAELSYLQPPSQPSAPPVERKEEPALPQWAQRLLEKPDTPDPRQSWRVAAASGQQPPPPAGRQIQWTAPAAIPQAPHITYRAMQPAEPVPPVPPASISDRELRRATEKIYRMIEERLRRELRRSGR